MKIAVLFFFLLGIEVSPLTAAEPILSEFMPANARVLADEDAQFTDWLEVHNPGAVALDLQGWFLTDSPFLLKKWSFPPVNLPANGYLVVFASGKNRVADPAHLHTSFQLNADGGYLALVKPDGTNIVSAYSYGSVKEDVSLGIAQSVVTTSLLPNAAPRVLVPVSSGDLPAAWNQPAFVPGGNWLTGPTPPAIGFDTNQTAGVPVNVAPSGTAAQSTLNGSFTPNLALNGNLGDFTHTLGTDPSPFWQVTLTNDMAIFSVVIFNRTSCCGSRLRDITIDIISTNSGVRVTNYTSALLNPENAGFAYPNGPAYLSNNLVSILGGPVNGRIVVVRRTPDTDLSGSAGQGNADEGAVLSLGEVVVNAASSAGLKPYITTDLDGVMRNVNSSAFVRLPFTLASPADSLVLNVRYDDGFVAYLNGVEIARRNAPAVPAWDSAATADRNFASAMAVESINVSGGLSALVPGANVLAVQLLNVAANNGDVLFQPELLASRVTVTTNVFFDDATPGTANTTDWYFDEVHDTHFSVDRGFFEAPISLVITSGTPDALVYCSINGDEPGPGKGFLYTNAIPITNTTILRTRAFKANWKPTKVDTATYLFLGDVIYQAANWEQTRLPPPNFPAAWGANSVDYGMDPQVVSNYTLAQWKEALTQIPSMSIVTEMKNLFDPTTGIYANASNHGEEWERPMSLELLDPTNAVPGRFQENGGLRIRGGASRSASFFKHSFRIFFNRGYGAGSLKYPLFENEGVQEFDKFDFRTSQNYSWPRNDNSQNDTMVREVFCRKTLGDMGQPYRRSRFYHLYLNGQYWGLYESDERPSAYYGEAYFGGSKTNYDVVKNHDRYSGIAFSTEATDGNLTAWSNLWVMCQVLRTNASNENYFRPLGRNADGTRNPSLPVMLDLDNLIDYMLGIFYTGDGDATLSAFLSNNQPNNWYGLRDRSNPEIGFRFFNNDCEHTLGSPNSQVDRTGPFGGSNEGNFTFSNPQWFHEELMRNPEYRVRFGDHVQKHFFNGGALTLQANTNRFIAKSVQITKAIRAYSARWGDAVRPTQPFGESDWTNAIAFCLDWMTNRASVVLAQLRTDSLFPSLAAPGLSHLGGQVAAGYNLVLNQTNASGVIYFTLDGSDPRLVNGGVSPAAQAYTTPIVVNAPTHVRSRVLNGSTWSAIVETILYPPQDLSRLIVSEIMYHPPTAGLVNGDEFEFLELKNTAPYALNLGGLHFTGGITFTFTNGTFLAPGQFIVLVRNAAMFAAKYPGVAYQGVYLGGLGNGGETLSLDYPSGASLLSVNYGDRAPWATASDGLGFSLVTVNPNANPNPSRADSWRASSTMGGSPGADDPATSLPPILINEVLTASLPPALDAIELFNPTAVAVNIGGWFLTDSGDEPKKFRIPDGTIITNGGYLVFDEADFNATPGATNSFSLRAEGDDLYLFSADAAGNLTGYSHGFSFGAAAEGVTFGRLVLSTGEEDLAAQLAGSLGGSNAGPRIGPVVINEIHYHPNSVGDEFVEIRNITGAPVDLFDPAHPTNTWRFNGLDLNFPMGVTLAANGLALVVAGDPPAFRAKYNVPAGVPVFGPYAGQLQDGGERLELQRPGPQGTNSSIPFITVDAVRFNDKAPWPAAADGSGPSLQRKGGLLYGNDPINWEAAIATPGRAFSGGVAPTITMQPVSTAVVATRDAMFAVTAAGPGPLFYQWLFNGFPIVNATNSLLELRSLQLAQSGPYSVQVFNEGGSVVSAEAILTVLPPANIVAQPQSINMRGSTNLADYGNATNNATFNVLAFGNGDVTYQWRFNGTNIAGAHGTSLVVTNVQLTNDGIYDVLVTDDNGTILSAPARLSVLITPVFVQVPLGQTLPAGSLLNLSVAVRGNPPPFGYQWRSNSLIVPLIVSNSRTNFFSIRSATNAATATYRIVVTNAASQGNGVVSQFTVTTVADTDLDGLPDALEVSLGLNPNDPSDAAGDLDHDGMSNRNEVIAGTDPADGNSYLRVTQMTLPGTALVQVPAVSNRTYSVQFTDALRSENWQTLADLPARSTNRVESIADPNWTTQRFYRIVLPAQP